MRASRAALLALTALLLVFYAPLFFGRVMVDRDLFRLFIPDAHVLRQALFNLEWPLWNPYQRLGQPFAATLQSQVYYPPHVLLTLLFSPARAISVQIVLHIGLLAAGLYAFCRAVGLNRAPAFIAAAGAAFTPLMSQMNSQLNIVSALGWTGFQLLAVRRFVAERSTRAFALATLSFTASLLCGSPEIFLMQLLIAAAFIVSIDRRRSSLLALAIPAVSGLAAMVMLLPGAEFAKNSMRTIAVAGATKWSTTLVDLGSFAVIPNHGFIRPTFLPTTMIGVVVVFLALIAIVNLRGPAKAAWPFAVCAFVLIFLSLGKTFIVSELLLKIPPLSLFRYPMRYLLGAVICLAILAGFGAQALLSVDRKRRFILTLFALMVIEAGVVFSFETNLQVGWALGFGVAAALLALRPTAAILPLAVVCAVELVAARIYLRLPSWLPRDVVEHPSALAKIVDHSDGARISVDLEDIAGEELIEKSRDALFPLRWFEENLEAVEGYGAPEPKWVTMLIEVYETPRAFFDLASTKSFIRVEPPEFKDLKKAPERKGMPQVWLSDTALPRAFIVQKGRPMSDDDAAKAFGEPTFDAKHVALLEASAPPRDGPDCESKVTRTVLSTREQHYTVAACADGYLHIGDAWYPGWAATVDGVPAPIYRANLAFRAVPVTAGQHDVVLSYSPWTSRIGASISLLTLAVLGWALVRRPKQSAALNPAQ